MINTLAMKLTRLSGERQLRDSFKPTPWQQSHCTCARTRKSVGYVSAGVHNAKAEECTTPYMRQNIEINIGVGGLHGNQGY